MTDSNSVSHVMPTYNKLPVCLTHGEGVWLWDENGRKYLDGLSGIAVNTLGHGHPRLVAALREQLGLLVHTSNLYHVRYQEILADKLTSLASMERVFFCNSGLEANEAAIKIARKYGHQRGISHPGILVYDHAFHGRSLATLSATGNPKVQKGFEPLVEGFVRIALNDLPALNAALDGNPNIVAIFIEAIQGEGGINAAHLDYLVALRRVCDERGLLLMVDEVQCGTGRTGKWFAHQWAGIVPDVMPLAKGLASGVPVGAVLVRGAASDVLGPGEHGSTFGGNPLAMRAAIETIAIVEDEGLLDNATRVGEQLMQGLRSGLSGHSGFVEVRGRGLMIGLELAMPCGTLPREALEYGAQYGMLINVTQERVLRLLPSLVMSSGEAELLISGLTGLVSEFLAKQ